MNKYQYKVKGVDYEVEIAEVEGNIAKVNVNGIPFEIELQRPINAAKHPSMKTKPTPNPSRGEGNTVTTIPANNTNKAPLPAGGAGGASVGAGSPLKAPLPGTISDIKVTVGQQVNAGDTVLVLEAMKMQNNIEAEHAGKVTAIMVKPGDTVMEGTPLLTIG